MRSFMLLTLLVLAGCAVPLNRSDDAVEGARGSLLRASVPFSY